LVASAFRYLSSAPWLLPDLLFNADPNHNKMLLPLWWPLTQVFFHTFTLEGVILLLVLGIN
jgi:hypothetical protein